MNREGHLKISRSIIIIMTVAYAAIAGAEQGTGLERCARLVSDSERLACFDEVFKQQQERSEAPASVEPPQGSVAAPGDVAVESPSEARAVTQSETTVQEVQPSRRQDESPNGKRDPG